MKPKTLAQIRKKYTRVIKIGDAWNVYLQIDVQGFTVIEQTHRRRAVWYSNMLAKALQRLIKENQ